MGLVDGNRPVRDNDWETITKGGEQAIEKWINDQLKGCSCTIVLVGQNTANRKWINYEIVRSWNGRMGVVGIRIHGLENSEGWKASAGANPFDYITLGERKLSAIVKCYNPKGSNSQERYSWIRQHLANAVEEAIKIRQAN